MTETLPLSTPTPRLTVPTGFRFADAGRLVVAVIYAAMLVAAPLIVRYAPAPSATPVAVTLAEERTNCLDNPAADDCTRPGPRR